MKSKAGDRLLDFMRDFGEQTEDSPVGSDGRVRFMNEFYEILGELRERVGGCRRLCECKGKSGWPERGVYFFLEDGEFREDQKTLRVVRVGTHAITATSKTTLWNRLHTHRGHSDLGGNHRGSIFRKRIGEALLESEAASQPHPDLGCSEQCFRSRPRGRGSAGTGSERLRRADALSLGQRSGRPKSDERPCVLGTQLHCHAQQFRTVGH
jgi:hypothetical protein